MAFRFRDDGHHARHCPPGDACRVDAITDGNEIDTGLAPALYQRRYVRKAAPQPVKAGHDNRVARMQCERQCVNAGALKVLSADASVLDDMHGINARRYHGFALFLQRVAMSRLSRCADANIAVFHFGDFLPIACFLVLYLSNIVQIVQPILKTVKHFPAETRKTLENQGLRFFRFFGFGAFFVV